MFMCTRRNSIMYVFWGGVCEVPFIYPLTAKKPQEVTDSGSRVEGYSLSETQSVLQNEVGSRLWLVDEVVQLLYSSVEQGDLSRHVARSKKYMYH